MAPPRAPREAARALRDPGRGAKIGRMLVALALASALRQDPGGALEVYLVDEHGGLLTDGWTVQAGMPSGPTTWVRKSKTVDPTTGLVRFEDMEGVVRVQGRHRSGDATEWTEVSVPSSGTLVHELVGPRTARSLFVDVRGPTGLSSSPSELVARDAAGRVAATLVRGPSGTFVARDVDPGVYRIEVHDPRFVPLLLERHATGEYASAVLHLTSRVVVRFVDAVDGSDVVPTSATWTTQRGATTNVHAFTQHDAPARYDFALEAGLPLELTATFEAHLDVQRSLPPLEPAELRHLVVAVTRGHVVEGVLRDSSGASLEGVVVQSCGPLRLPPGGDSRTFVMRFPMTPAGQTSSPAVQAQLREMAKRMRVQGRALFESSPPRSCRTDAAGRFSLSGLVDEPREVRVCLTPWHVETVPLERDPATGAFAPLTLTLEHRGAADLDLVLDHPDDIHKLHFSLQLGDEPWLGPDALQVEPAVVGSVLALRGLPEVPCRLRITRWSGSSASAAPPSEVVEFLPVSGVPRPRPVDVRHLTR